MRHKKNFLLFLACALLLHSIKADTCPSEAPAGMFGPDGWSADGSSDEKTYYRYLTSDDHKKIDSVWYCLDATQNHLQGFVVTFVDEVDGSRKSLPYGAVNTGDDSCKGFYARSEIQWVQFKKDSYDVNGVTLGSTLDDEEFTFKTANSLDNDPLDSD
jgi:hypothetical protein